MACTLSLRAWSTLNPLRGCSVESLLPPGEPRPKVQDVETKFLVSRFRKCLRALCASIAHPSRAHACACEIHPRRQSLNARALTAGSVADRAVVCDRVKTFSRCPIYSTGKVVEIPCVHMHAFVARLRIERAHVRAHRPSFRR